jgi:O-antigen/teichoic acid export membrane protein
MTARIRLLKQILPDSDFGRGILKIVGGTAIAQIIAFGASPLLTRIYEPETFGIFATLMGLASILTVISSLSYDVAIPVPRRNTVAINTIILCLILLGIHLVVTTLLLLAFSTEIAKWFPEDTISPNWLFAIPMMVTILGFNQIATSGALRAQNFNAISSSKVIQASTTAICQAALSLTGAAGLIAGMVVGQIAGAKPLWNAAFPSESIKCISLRGVRRSFIRFRRFPLFEGPFSLVNSAGNFLPPVLLVAFFGTTIGGLFALAQRVLSAPIGMLASASGQVFFSSAAKANREGSLGTLVGRVHSNLTRLVLPSLMLIALTGPNAFSFIFGERWRDAGIIATLMTPWLYMQALGSSVSTVWVIQGNLHHGTIIGLIGFALRCSALFSAIWIRDWIQVIAIFSMVNALYYFVVAVYAVHFSGTKLSTFVTGQVKGLGVAIAITLPAGIGVYIGSAFPILVGVTLTCLLLLPYSYRALKNL